MLYEHGKLVQKSVSFIKQFISSESSGGILLIISAILAMFCANMPGLSVIYQGLVDLLVEVNVGTFSISKPLLLWVNDGLMAIFFFLIGLELKREVLDGELSEPGQIALPLIGAIGGMAVPALIYTFINFGDNIAMSGWAIPAATDIAFALGILSLLGPRVPLSLKVFLTSLAIFDDIGAIIIIAFFYTSKISMLSLTIAAVLTVVLLCLNRLGVKTRAPYFIVGLAMWVAMLKSGVHATLAGILIALFIPMNNPATGISPLKSLEKDLHGFVAYFVLPVFAFCNAGIFLGDITIDQFIHPVTIGITLGLFLGNQFGITSLCWIAIKCGLTKLPEGATWKSLYGTACLCGVGFTMSLFIGSLAFEETGVNQLFDERIGIFIGSALSGILGYWILKSSLKEQGDKA